MTLLLLAQLAAAAPWFYPGPGPETVELGPGPSIDGLPVGLTPDVAVRIDDPDALWSVPGVVGVQVLVGDGHTVKVTAGPGVDPVALSRELWARADVSWSHPDFVLPLVPHYVPDDPYVGDQWHIDNTGQGGGTVGVDIGALEAWDLSTGVGQLIAIIDTGVDLTHPDLRVVAGRDYIDRDDDPTPDPSYGGFPHGTACAGVAAASGDNGIGVAGVAFDADVYAIRLIGGSTSTTDVRDAFMTATDAGATVLSNSWGYEACPSYTTPFAIREGLRYAEEEGRGGLGTAVVASAGNDNCDMSAEGWLAEETVISVAAINRNDDREGYSSFGEPLDIAAPSGGLLTTDPQGEGGYGNFEGDPDYSPGFSGTSASAPVVAGVLALMFAANDRLTAADARRVLCDTAVRVDHGDAVYDDEGWSYTYGCGRVHAGRAVAAVANDAPRAPEATWPPGEVQVERAVLAWDAVDPDGDHLSWEVSWWLDADPSDVRVVTVDASRLDLSGEVGVGDAVSWTVVSIDTWGRGEPSEVAAFTVIPAPEPPVDEPRASCAVGPSGPGLLALVAGFGFVRRRSRRR